MRRRGRRVGLRRPRVRRRAGQARSRRVGHRRRSRDASRCWRAARRRSTSRGSTRRSASSSRAAPSRVTGLVRRCRCRRRRPPLRPDAAAADRRRRARVSSRTPPGRLADALAARHRAAGGWSRSGAPFPPGRTSGSSRRCWPGVETSPSSRTRSSSARAPRSTTSCTRTGSSSESRSRGPREVMTDALRAARAHRSSSRPLATAELAKYTSNAFLATLVSFSNEIARLCEATPGVDVEDVLGIVHRDRRLARETAADAGIVSYLKAGCGYGGSCLPKDLGAPDRATAATSGEPLALLQAVELGQPGQAAGSPGSPNEPARRASHGRRIAVLGAAFKAGTDDMRRLAGAASRAGAARAGSASVVVYDPLVAPRAAARCRFRTASTSRASLAAATADADACLVTTLDPEFLQLDRLLRRAQRRRDRSSSTGGARSIPADFPDVGVRRRREGGPWS